MKQKYVVSIHEPIGRESRAHVVLQIMNLTFAVAVRFFPMCGHAHSSHAFDDHRHRYVERKKDIVRTRTIAISKCCCLVNCGSSLICGHHRMQRRMHCTDHQLINLFSYLNERKSQMNTFHVHIY